MNKERQQKKAFCCKEKQTILKFKTKKKRPSQHLHPLKRGNSRQIWKKMKKFLAKWKKYPSFGNWFRLGKGWNSNYLWYHNWLIFKELSISEKTKLDVKCTVQSHRVLILGRFLIFLRLEDTYLTKFSNSHTFFYPTQCIFTQSVLHLSRTTFGVDFIDYGIENILNLRMRKIVTSIEKKP